jgi:hypothetical protein
MISRLVLTYPKRGEGEKRLNDGASGMYGPPPGCKRKVRGTRLVCANVYGLCWSEKTPGQDGMRHALFPFSYAVLGRLLPGPGFESAGLTVVPSLGSPANLAGNHKLLSLKSNSSSGDCGSPIGFPGSQHRPSDATHGRSACAALPGNLPP